MEHDEKCERVGTARSIAAKVNLSPGEFAVLIGENMVMDIACCCGDRKKSKFPQPVEKGELRRRTILMVLCARKAGHGGGLVAEVARQQLGMGMGIENGEGSRGGGRVIEVDFRNRRRL